ncbi:potassium-transporting ATPase subunit KdpA [Staphylococcus ratti]|uniref:Potassium-transporting ATPase potassium-binding subunit n=1 Tax=Staphylococcus ratti TaxID=2892440 RepID=A0ABY3PCT4_9STAP|nr:potassium-transporting ATPase subunit KdpA [Staphylococcus ratti]UEX90140.1 potassium-transporting ATPase subunit KdpA [Staphylococcus ratti]
MASWFILITLFLITSTLIGWYLYYIYFNYNGFLYVRYAKLEHTLAKLLRLKYKPQSAKDYLKSLLVTNGIAALICYVILRTQHGLWLNPNHIDNMSPDLAFNTVISFITNTNLQHYAGEANLSYFSQMTVITFLMFLSAASGFCIALAFIRRMIGNQDAIGSFNSDLIKFITLVLLPLSCIINLLLMHNGVIQTFSKNIQFETIDHKIQALAFGPVASLESIKHLGTNGGGFFGANSSMPFENPTLMTNMLEMMSMMMIPGAVFVLFGIVLFKKHLPSKKQAFYFIGLLLAIFTLFFIVHVSAEHMGNPHIPGANMEGKETRFGITQSALFTSVTTSFTTGTVDAMHDSLTALGGMVPLILMMINAVFGGSGVGFLNFMTYVLLTLFIAGLMIGRTPQLFGKRMESKEMTLVSIILIIHPLIVLVFSSIALSFPDAMAAITNPSEHGISQILYEYTSASANNGSGFEGLKDNTTFWNITTGLAMFLGRYPAMILQLFIASLLVRKPLQNTANEMAIDTPIFNVLLVVIILTISALTFLPGLVLGPIGEYLTS